MINSLPSAMQARKASAHPILSPSASQQKQVAIQPLKFGAAPQSGLSMGRKLLNRLDFRDMGISHINQIQIIYAACIGSRLIAANERRKASPSKSFNEIRESLLRDSVGYLFWFFATPLLQRLYLKGATHNNPAMAKALIQDNPAVKDPKGMLDRISTLNPLTRWNIPSSEQVKDQMEQALLALKQKGIKPSEKAYTQTEKFYQELMKHRNLATGLGLASTIVLLGIGINLLNFYMTRRNVARRRAEMQKSAIPALLPAIPNHLPLPATLPSLLPSPRPRPPISFQPTAFQPLQPQGQRG